MDLGKELDVSGRSFETVSTAVVATGSQVFHVESGNIQILDKLLQQAVGKAKIAGSRQISGLVHSVHILRLLGLALTHPASTRNGKSFIGQGERDQRKGSFVRDTRLALKLKA